MNVTVGTNNKTDRTPLTILTGYLGAGKTTLIRHILQRSNKKLAIIMNEFGDIPIDAKIIEGKNVNIAELAGGCVCCSLTGEFELAIKEVIEKANPAWIILETTGVAEPGAITFDIQESLPEVRLDAIITIVDGDAMVKFPSLGHTGQQQIEMADIIILNKIDLLDSRQTANIETRLREINPRSIITKAIQSKVPPEFLFGLNKKHEIDKSKIEKSNEHKSHEIESEVFVFESDLIFNKQKFTEFANSLPKEIYRSKGFIICENNENDKNNKGNESYLFNYVAGRFELEPFVADKIELVFIGKDILKLEKDIKERLEMCKTK